MPRLPRINLEGAIYYVTSKGAQNQELFKDQADYKMYLELLAKYKKEHKFKLFSYCLLPGRLELLIEASDDATISEIMHDLNSLYTKYFNGRYGKHGHLFDSRFRSVLVEKAKYLLKVSRHIHLSPAPDIKEYPYSSFGSYIVNEQPAAGPRGFTPAQRIDMSGEIKEVMSFLNEKDDPRVYERYCLEGDADEIEELTKKLKRGSVLGSETFETQVRNRIKQYTDEQKEAANFKGPSRPNRVLIVMVGLMVLVVAPSAIFLYISRQSLENKYALLKVKETEFAEKARFENQNPIAPAELEGTEWEIEMVPKSVSAENATIKDKIRFIDGRMISDRLKGQGFHSGSYFLQPQGRGLTSWLSAQSSSNGDTVSWVGEWRGDVMKGKMAIRTTAESPQEFSFFSVKWSYSRETK